jgi:hypothetical protein
VALNELENAAWDDDDSDAAADVDSDGDDDFEVVI